MGDKANDEYFLEYNEDDEVQYDDVENNDSDDGSDDDASRNSTRSSSHFSSRQWPQSYKLVSLSLARVLS